MARIDLRNGIQLLFQLVYLLSYSISLSAKVVNRYKGFTGAVCDVSFANDGTTFAACGLDRFLCVYRTESPTLLHRVLDHIYSYSSSTFFLSRFICRLI